MAVVSISRIQQRRGRKFSGTGLPQLASGELGWAIDSQELFIGNGSVSEGAPKVGNTRLLTELDIPNLKGESSNLFSSLNYIYKASGSIRTFEITHAGTHYTDGIYSDVLLEWVANGNPLTLPTATITVANGTIVKLTITSPGYGISYNSTFTVPLNSLGPELSRPSGSQNLLLTVTSVTGPLVPIKYTSIRSVQSRLDDRVNSTDFGTVGNGIEDDTVSLQNAINQLFLNVPPVITLYGKSTYGSFDILADNASYSLIGASISGPGIPGDTTIVSVIPGASITLDNYSTSTETTTQIFTITFSSDNFIASSNPEFRVTLEIPPGTYNISNSLYIPSYASIVGAGLDKTILNFNRIRSIIGDSEYNSHIINTSSASSYMIGATISGPGISNGTFVTEVIESVCLIINNVATSTNLNTSYDLSIVKDDAVIKFVNELSAPGSPGKLENTTADNQAKFITFKNLSINVNDTIVSGIQLDSVSDSIIENISMKSNWSTMSQTFNSGILLTAVSSGITCKNILFNNISIQNFGYGIYSSFDIINNKFINGLIENCTFGSVFGEFTNPSIVGKQSGPKNTTIDNFKFSNIINQAIWNKSGVGNSFSNIQLENVGTNNGITLYPQIYSDVYGNSVSNILSDRWAYYSLPIRLSYIPEVSGKFIYNYPSLISLQISYSLTSVKLCNLQTSASLLGIPQNSINHEVDYEYTSNIGNYTRKGTLIITADITNNQIHLSDEYDFIGNEDFLQSLKFSVNFTGSYAISISYTNILQQDTGTICFSYKSTSR